jgi:hypothetical protein
MTMEDWHLNRLLTIAQMAATLEAGDRASCAHPQAFGFFGTMESAPAPEYYAKRAEALYDAASALDGGAPKGENDG